MLQVWLLGQFEVKLEGRRVVLSARAAQSLLAYLMLSAGTPHRREKLAGLLWSDLPEGNARRNLRHEVWRIRKALVSPTQTTAEYIIGDELTLQFNRNAVYWLDAAQLQKPETHLSTPLESSLESLISALSLYRGELLPGMYDDWVSLERERLQAVFEGKMQLLLEKLIDAHRWNTVIEWSERWIAQGQTPESAYRALMVAHGALGNVSQVALDYERCVEALRDDLGVQPSGDTRGLFETITRGGTSEARIATPLPTVFVQPSGTITFLFSDIEGSTKLLEQLGNEYATLLADQRDLLRAAAEQFNGHEVDTQGDSFFFAFFRAADAVSFATKAQRALAAHKWPHDATLRVRMGLHTGEPMLARTGYVGMDVHRAARIGAAGHGGQVLLSQTTGMLVENQLPDGATLVDLGEHKLKDLRYPVHIIQLSIEDLPSDFPPLKAISSGIEPPAPGEPPFKGLEFFDEKDADLFFGREELTAKLMQGLRQSQFLAVVVGASGSGKSSVVRAGVVPALKQGAPLADGTLPPAESSAWTTHIFTPTAHPLEALATELTRNSESITATATLVDDLAKDPRALHLFLRRQAAESKLQVVHPKSPSANCHTLLVIDQFEELFTLCRDEFEREAFIDNLLTALSYGDDGLVTMMLTIRADFYAHLAQYPELRDAVAKHQEFIGPMTSEELRRAMQEPVRRGGWEFEPGLVDLILRDVGDEPGALPLLSHALLETWKRRSGHTLTLKGYHDAGGVRGAIAQTAESVYQQLTAQEQGLARAIFLRLTELGEGTEDTRRHASFVELIPHDETAASVHAVLMRLADARLITLDENSAQVAHEALIREWPQLREWLNQDREGLRLHRQVTEAAQEWQWLERDAGALYRGGRLAHAREWATANPQTLNADERAFLRASEEQEKKEEREKIEQQTRELEHAQNLATEQRARAEETTHANKKLRQRAVFLAGALVLAIFLAAIALFLNNRSNQNAVRAEQNALTARQNAIAAVEAKDDAEAQRNIAIQAQANADTQRAQAEKSSRVATARELAASADNNLAVDPERSILLALQSVKATAPNEPVLTEAQNALHNAVFTTRIEKTVNANDALLFAMAYSPDGTQLATGGGGYDVRIWDTTTYKNVMTLKNANTLKGNYFGVNSIAYSSDGKRIATAADDNSAKVWDAATGQIVFELKGHSGPVYPVTFRPDDKQLATLSLDNTIKFWDAATGQEQQTWKVQDPGAFLTYSPDGLRVLYVDNGELRVVEVESGKEIYKVPVFDYIFALSPNGKLLAVMDLDVIRILDASNGQPIVSITRPNNRIERMAFTPDSSRLAAAGRDRLIHLWDAATGAAVLTLPGHTEFIFVLGFSPDGKHIASGDQSGFLKIWSLEPTQEILTIPASSARLELSPDGTRILATGCNSSSCDLSAVRVYDAQSGKLVLEQTTESGEAFGIAFSPDGRELAAVGKEQNIRISDAANGTLRLEIPVEDEQILGLAYSPSGELLAAVGTGEKIRLFQRASGKELASWDAGLGSLARVAFSPDGLRLGVVSNATNDVKIYDISTTTHTGVAPTEEPLTLKGHTNSNWGIDFNSDGARVVTSGRDATARIWDAATGKLLTTMTGHTSTVVAVDFSPDDRRVVTGSQDGTVRVWDAATGQELLTLKEPGTGGVVFTPDGKRLILAGVTIKILTLEIDKLVQIAESRLTRTWTQEECERFLHTKQCPAP